MNEIKRFMKRSRHDKILILIAWAVAMVMLTSACFLDSDNCGVFLSIMLVCVTYLGLFTYANRDRGGIL